LKSLVVYYSRTGNARFVAETIAAEIGADVEEVVDMKKRSGPLGISMVVQMQGVAKKPK